MMNVYAISDMHGNLPDVPRDADLIVLGGDICPDFRPYGRRTDSLVDQGGTQQAQWLGTVFREWIDSFSCPVVATWGNHDFVGERSFLDPGLRWRMLRDQRVDLRWPRLSAAADGFVDVRATKPPPSDTFEYNEISVYGTPWVPGLPYWAFYGRPAALQARAEAIPEGLDILITHGPPHRVGDFIPTSDKQRNKYGNYGGMHVGDPTLNEAIERARPRVVICGHIHEARGSYYLDGIPVYNCAAVDHNYVLHDEPWTQIDL
jgi:Icc-related predicted phosphoesterase